MKTYTEIVDVAVSDKVWIIFKNTINWHDYKTVKKTVRNIIWNNVENNVDDTVWVSVGRHVQLNLTLFQYNDLEQYRNNL